MQGRIDDNIETIRKRFRVFVEQSIPVVEYYEKQGKVRKVSIVLATLTLGNDQEATEVWEGEHCACIPNWGFHNWPLTEKAPDLLAKAGRVSERSAVPEAESWRCVCCKEPSVAVPSPCFCCYEAEPRLAAKLWQRLPSFETGCHSLALCVL